MKARSIIKLFVIFFILYNLLINYAAIKTLFSSDPIDVITGKFTEISETVTDQRAPVIEKDGSLLVYFCPRDDCEGQALAFMQGATKQIHCALFDLDLFAMLEFFDAKSTSVDVKIVVDNENDADVHDLPYIKKDTKSQLSHNKFCVIDDNRVWTGSFNPTENDAHKNNNNLLLVQSRALASNYEAEFKELWNGEFGKGAQTKKSFVDMNGTLLENYFCPEDWCANKVIFTIKEAKHSVLFMTFSFTHDQIGNAIRKKALGGLDVRGVFEKSQNNDYTEYDLMKTQGMNVRWDGNPKNMHHKVFIIDNRTVITGSFNPTRNGDQVNDENILIIHDENITKEFLQEFDLIWSQTSDFP